MHIHIPTPAIHVYLHTVHIPYYINCEKEKLFLSLTFRFLSRYPCNKMTDQQKKKKAYKRAFPVYTGENRKLSKTKLTYFPNITKIPSSATQMLGDFSVVQWLRIGLPVQRTWVCSCPGISTWLTATTTEPTCYDYLDPCAQSPCSTMRSHDQEKPKHLHGKVAPPTSLQLEKSLTHSNQDLYKN